MKHETVNANIPEANGKTNNRIGFASATCENVFQLWKIHDFSMRLGRIPRARTITNTGMFARVLAFVYPNRKKNGYCNEMINEKTMDNILSVNRVSFIEKSIVKKVESNAGTTDI